MVTVTMEAEKETAVLKGKNHKNQDRYTPMRKEAEVWQEEDQRKKQVRSM